MAFYAVGIVIQCIQNLGKRKQHFQLFSIRTWFFRFINSPDPCTLSHKCKAPSMRRWYRIRHWWTTVPWCCLWHDHWSEEVGQHHDKIAWPFPDTVVYPIRSEQNTMVNQKFKNVKNDGNLKLNNSFGCTLAKSSLLLGESLPNRCSVVEHESMNVWAITLKHASTVVVLLMSNMKSGFLMKFTQNRNGKLETQEKKNHKKLLLKFWLRTFIQINWPIRFPCMNNIHINDAMAMCRLVQQIKEPFNCWW